MYGSWLLHAQLGPCASKLLRLLFFTGAEAKQDMSAAGQKLRMLRERLGFTMREVENASLQIAQRHHNNEFFVPPSRLSGIEAKGVVPSIHGLYSLATIYRRNMLELLAWYDIDLNPVTADMDFVSPPKSHILDALASLSTVHMPVRLDPSFDPRRTTNFCRMVEAWGVVPIARLAQFAKGQYTYGYVGSEDFTMYPILPPGSFVQIDESKNKVEERAWRSQYGRPIYFVETRRGYTCCWCTVGEGTIILTPHPLSPVAAQVMRYPQEAEVIGQVVGVAMKLAGWRPDFGPPASSKAHEAVP